MLPEYGCGSTISLFLFWLFSLPLSTFQVPYRQLSYLKLSMYISVHDKDANMYGSILHWV